jgi:two-component system, NtrC family, response regulator HydG
MNLRNANILIVDDDTDVLTAVRLLLKSQVQSVVTEKNPELLRGVLKQQKFDILLLDMNFNAAVNTGNEGLYWLKKVKDMSPQTAVVMITAYGDIDLAVRSLKEGAADFMLKPWHNDKLVATLSEVLKVKSGEKKNPTTENIIGTSFLGESDAMKDVFLKLDKIAPTHANVLILGENGTGKDVMAQAIHQKSNRSDKPFVKVDVGALTESLFESELFGYKKGAFTDAKEDRMGRFEAANGGTLFLDEIGNISLRQQAKLLSVLQNRTVTRLGSTEQIPIDMRLICATNLPLSLLADESRFRKDLIYRIYTVDLNLPPLRVRGNDIVVLANHFIQIYTEKYAKPHLKLSNDAIDKLKSHPFPGNVRELQFTIERAVIMADDAVLRGSDLTFSALEASQNTEGGQNDFNLNQVEKNTILKVIEKHNGNITKAAKELGLTRTALYRRLGKYEL